VARDWQRNNCWPEAFLPADRLATRAPFVVMVHNGWRRQNLVADHHFAEGTGTLKESGELKIRWIMTQAPRQHRTIYVHRAATPEQTAKRMEAVQAFAAKFARNGDVPVVEETDIDMAGLPAVQVDTIDRKWLESAPAPRMPDSGGTGASSTTQ
jgi:alkanesulfonate monooxygenase SsuD/methylene tetrahydromethanopterin reductase-like flavin-dependent oxidoreductase (luciferase family)